APIVLVWDNLGGHTSTAMRALIASRPWLRVYTLPAYAPELNPVVKVWSRLKRGLATSPPAPSPTSPSWPKPDSRRCSTPTTSPTGSSRQPGYHPRDHQTLILQNL